MKLMAIPTRDGMVDNHFGHCAYYTVVTLDDQNQVVKQERLDSPEGCGCKSNIASVMQEMGITLMLAGILTDDPEMLEAAIEQFDNVWIGKFCKGCGRREYFADPIK